MRSYSYTSGNWQICTTDTLPPSAHSSYPPSSEWETFKAALHQRGFSSSSSLFTCLSGFLRLYVRDHNKLKAKQQEQEYNFLAVFHLADSWIRVWITDLPNVLLFLREVSAQPASSEQSLAEVVDEAWHKMFHDEDVQSLILTAGQAFAKLADGEVEITVKPPKQPRPAR